MNISLAMFDVGGVLIDHDEERHFRRLAEFLGVPSRQVISMGSIFARQLERGEITMREVEERFSKRFGISSSKIRGSWSRTFKESIKVKYDMIDLLEKLSAEGIKIALTTNTNPSDYKSLFGKEGALRKLRKYRIFASCYVGSAKPDPKYYWHVLESMKADPEHTLFVDDKASYVKGAEALKINAILFRNYESLVRQLIKMNLNVG